MYNIIHTHMLEKAMIQLSFIAISTQIEVKVSEWFSAINKTMMCIFLSFITDLKTRDLPLLYFYKLTK